MHVGQTTFRDQENHIEVVTYANGERRKFWVAKSNMKSGKDGRLYARHKNLTLAVDNEKTPPHYSLLMRKDSPKTAIAKPVPPRPLKAEPEQLLGDTMENYLAKMGVTPENYTHAKEAFGMIPSCNCPERKKIINDIHSYAKEHGWLKAIVHSREIAKQVAV